MFSRALSKQTFLRGAVAALAWLVLAGAAHAVPGRFTLGPDSLGVGRVLTEVGNDGTAIEKFALGDGSQAFNGLSYRVAESRFYAIASDFTGESQLVSFADSGAASLSTLGSLGAGVYGLALGADDNFYAAANSPFGESTLLRVSTGGATTTVGALGLGFMGGLAFAGDGTTLYGISGDAFGVQRVVNRIDAATGAATALFELGDGSVAFNGGLTFDTASGAFEIIGSDFTGVSSLYRFAASDATSLSLVGAIGPGFMNAGLAIAPAAPVPEPATWALWLVALAALAAQCSARRRAGGGTRR